MKTNLPEWIVCPKTLQKLKVNEKTLTYQDNTYPFINDIPWLFKNPEFYFLEWSTKIETYFKQEEGYLTQLQTQMNRVKSTLTKKRLSKIHEAKIKNLKLMKKTLTPFLGHQPIALGQSTQQIYSYFQLIFRDWSWRGEEVKVYEDFVSQNIQKEDKKILILGAGACGLSYHLANKFPEKEVVSLDHNPFLFSIAKRIFEGHEIKLSDFSYYPKSIEKSAQSHKIKFPKLETQNHHFVLGRFPDLSFDFDTFDIIIAPWFFDILETPFIDSVKYILNFLTPQGSFLLYGPNNVHKSNIMDQITSQEVVENLKPLFEDFQFETQQLTYLESPLDSQQRKETIQFLAAKKLKREDHRFPIPTSKDIFEYDAKFEQYKAVNSTFYNILKYIEGPITEKELAPKIQKEFNFTQEESFYYAKIFLEKIIKDIANG